MEIRYTKGLRIFMHVFTPLFILGGAAGLYYMVNYTQAESSAVLSVAGLYAGFSILSLLGLLDVRKSNFILGEERLTKAGIFGTHEIPYDEVKGFKVDDNFLKVYSKDKRYKTIKVSAQFTEHFDELVRWMNTHFDDLDLVEFEEEQDEIFGNSEFGSTEEEREHLFKRAKNISRILNVTGSALGLALFFNPVYYELMMIACAAFPVFILMALNLSNGLIRLNEEKNSPYPSVVYGFVIPVLCFGVRVLMDFELMEIMDLLPHMLGFGFFMFLLLMGSTKEFRKLKVGDIIAGLTILIICLYYSYAVLVTLNVMPDQSEAQLFEPEVLDKRISKGKRSYTYYVKVAAWGPVQESKELTVDRKAYDRIEKGETVKILLKEGYLKAPWYKVEAF